jgi:nucleosome assembly protein 1-like 1
MANHDMIGEYVTERDAEVLSHLRDVRHISLTGDDAGSFKVEFHFNKNPFFTNEVRPPLLVLLLLVLLLLLRVVVFVSYAYVSATAM